MEGGELLTILNETITNPHAQESYLPADFIGSVVYQILLGVEFMHSHGITHRDLYVFFCKILTLRKETREHFDGPYENHRKDI